MSCKLGLFVALALLVGDGNGFVAATPVGFGGADAGIAEEHGKEALSLRPRLSELDAIIDSPDGPESDGGCPTTVLAGDGSTSGNGRGPIATIRYERAVYLITAAELAASGFPVGPVSGIGWTYGSSPGIDATGSLVLYLENTAATTNTKSTTWAAAIAGMTTVHDAITTLPAASGPFDVVFSGGSPFSYTGGGLYVAFDWQYPSGTLTNAVNVCTTTLAGGTMSGLSNAVPVTSGLVSSNFRPETRLTTGGAAAQTDASVDFVIAPGSLPVGLVGPQTIQAVITNRGANPLIDLLVSMDITGPDARSSTQLIGSLGACGGRATVSFPPFTPTALGSDVITASVPSDEVPSNDSETLPMDDTIALYSYKHPGTTADAGVGLTGSTGAFVSKFTTTVAAGIAAVNLEFFAAGATQYRVAIYAESGSGTPGMALLYLDAADRTVGASGPVTIQLPTVLSVGPGSFYVGIHQTNTVNASLSADFERPVRAGVQYMASSLPPASWVDFAPGNDFNLNIGVVLDRCAEAPTASNGGPICEGATLHLSASPPNAASYAWTGPNGFTSSLRTPSVPDATVVAAGAYSVTVNGCASEATTIAVVHAEGDTCASPDECTSYRCTAGACQAAATDSDADGVADACDNCELESNAGQSDFDGDGQGDRCDLDDGVIWEWRDNRTSLAWQAEQGTSSWNVYRGDMSVLRATGVYSQAPGSNALAARQCGFVAPIAADGGVPGVGAVSFSLVSGVIDGTEGSLGSSSGGPRPNHNPCP